MISCRMQTEDDDERNETRRQQSDGMWCSDEAGMSVRRVTETFILASPSELCPRELPPANHVHVAGLSLFGTKQRRPATWVFHIV